MPELPPDPFSPDEFCSDNRALLEVTTARIDDYLSLACKEVRTVDITTDSSAVRHGLVTPEDVQQKYSQREQDVPSDGEAFDRAAGLNRQLIDRAEQLIAFASSELVHILHAGSEGTNYLNADTVSAEHFTGLDPSSARYTERLFSRDRAIIGLGRVVLRAAHMYSSAAYYSVSIQGEATIGFARLLEVDERVIRTHAKTFPYDASVYQLVADYFPGHMDAMSKLLAGHFSDQKDLDNQLAQLAANSLQLGGSDHPDEILLHIRRYCVSVNAASHALQQSGISERMQLIHEIHAHLPETS